MNLKITAVKGDDQILKMIPLRKHLRLQNVFYNSADFDCIFAFITLVVHKIMYFKYPLWSPHRFYDNKYPQYKILWINIKNRYSYLPLISPIFTICKVQIWGIYGDVSMMTQYYTKLQSISRKKGFHAKAFSLDKTGSSFQYQIFSQLAKEKFQLN